MSLFVTELGLSKRISSALVKADYTTVQSLIYMTEAEFLKIKGLGRKALAEVNTQLQDQGKSIGMVTRLSQRPYPFCKCCKVYHKEAA
jgi:DNA-directed RNA polymerase alpha subunit